MKKKWIFFIAGLGVLTVLAAWLKPREYRCQRCRSVIIKSGPLMIRGAMLTTRLSPVGAGDPSLYCKRNGHILVKKIDPIKQVNDWMYQRDSYKTEEEYQNAINPDKSDMPPNIRSIQDIDDNDGFGD